MFKQMGFVSGAGIFGAPSRAGLWDGGLLLADIALNDDQRACSTSRCRSIGVFIASTARAQRPRLGDQESGRIIRTHFGPAVTALLRSTLGSLPSSSSCCSRSRRNHHRPDTSILGSLFGEQLPRARPDDHRRSRSATNSVMRFQPAFPTTATLLPARPSSSSSCSGSSNSVSARPAQTSARSRSPRSALSTCSRSTRPGSGGTWDAGGGAQRSSSRRSERSRCGFRSPCSRSARSAFVPNWYDRLLDPAVDEALACSKAFTGS